VAVFLCGEPFGSSEVRRHHESPVIVVTAERGDDVAKILNDGISTLPKPFSLDALQLW